jgi:hypothetical protein
MPYINNDSASSWTRLCLAAIDAAERHQDFAVLSGKKTADVADTNLYLAVVAVGWAEGAMMRALNLNGKYRLARKGIRQYPDVALIRQKYEVLRRDLRVIESR